MGLATHAAYTQAPLIDPSSQIRLLRLLPQQDANVLDYEITTHQLDILSNYVAVSYQWGQSTPSRHVRINGHEMSVRQNCYEALLQVNARFPGVLIWIDSICINQDNLKERGLQVEIMGSIYAKAHCVAACIGPATDDSTWLMNSLASGNIDDMRYWLAGLDATDTAADDSTWFMKSLAWGNIDDMRDWLAGLDATDTATRVCFALSSLANRPYWRRLWIVQELPLANAREILCGTERLSWPRLEALMLTSFGHGLRESPLHHLTQTYWGRHNLLEVIIQFGDYQCMDPRDHVYAVMSFADGGPQSKAYAIDMLRREHGNKCEYDCNLFQCWQLEMPSANDFAMDSPDGGSQSNVSALSRFGGVDYSEHPKDLTLRLFNSFGSLAERAAAKPFSLGNAGRVGEIMRILGVTDTAFWSTTQRAGRILAMAVTPFRDAGSELSDCHT